MPTGELAPGQVLGLAGLIRQRILAGAVALDELEVLVAPIALVEELMQTHPALARDMGRAIDIRVRSQVAAMADLIEGRAADTRRSPRWPCSARPAELGDGQRRGAICVMHVTALR